ncbi:hypothetical protein V7124_04015 [Neobacillus niacini]|uniref:hypothetical protein n=1 Tax=Neobacillus niacini TaxID=86668 RepID=UPI002FFF0946
MRNSIEKVVPHCIFCKKELKTDEFVYMDGIMDTFMLVARIGKGISFKAGKYEEIVSKYPHYFGNFKVQQ